MCDEEFIAHLTRALLVAKRTMREVRDEGPLKTSVKQKLTNSIRTIEATLRSVEDQCPGLICSCMYEVLPSPGDLN